MSKSGLGGLAVCAAALSLAACNKPAEPAAAPEAAATPAAEATAAPAAASGLPADVVALTENFELCEHFAGEEPYDDARRAEIDAAIEANCRPVKNALPGLKTKYAGNAAVMAVLTHWEELVGSMD
jgi:hypothetical protein